MTTKIDGSLGVDLIKDGTIVAADFAASLFAASLTGNGYQKLPSGLIIQWGNATTDAAGVVTVTFPIPFTTACLQTFATAATAARIMTAAGPLSSLSSAAFYSHNDSGVGAASDFRWLAIGH